jgi:hypothetical protein
MFRDANRNGFGIIFHVSIIKSNDVPAFLFDNRFPSQVRFTNCIVVATIDFDDELVTHTSEVNIARTYWVLPTELKATDLFATKHAPQQFLRFGLGAPE